MQQAPPPAHDGAKDYAFYPASSVATMNIEALLRSKSAVKKYYWQWANHGPRKIPKGNLVPSTFQSRSVKAFFSSHAAADACTLAQTAAVLGLRDAAKKYLRDAGVVESYQPTAGVQDTKDVCLLSPTPVVASTDGILLDYEVADGRTPQWTLEFLSKFARLTKSAGKEVLLYTNPLDAPTQPLTGVHRSNIREITNLFDKVSVFLWRKNRQRNIQESFYSQLDIIGAVDPGKLFLVFELNGTTFDDARAVRALLDKHRIGTVSLWRNYSNQGGNCDTEVNRKIRCVSFGRC